MCLGFLLSTASVGVVAGLYLKQIYLWSEPVISSDTCQSYIFPLALFEARVMSMTSALLASTNVGLFPLLSDCKEELTTKSSRASPLLLTFELPQTV